MMSYEAMITIVKSCIYTLAIILTCIICPAYPDSPGVPQPYSTPVGGALFVMLTGRCEKVTEVRSGLTKHESQLLLEQIDARLKEEKNKITNKRMLNPCAYLNGGIHRLRNDPGLWELRIDTFKWKPKDSLSSDTGEFYAQSGLYPDHGSVVPIWSVNWYADNVHLSNDGRYLIRFGPWASTYDELAVAFYNEGVLLHAYAIKDLIREPEKLPRSVSHLQWAYEMQFDEDKNILHLSTFGNEIYEFDVTTGMLAKSSFNVLPVFTVDAVIQSGEHYTLSDFQSTRGSYVSINNEGLGESRRQYAFGQVDIEEGDASQAQEYGVPFSFIEQIDRVYESDTELVKWRIRLRTGDVIDMQITDPYGLLPSEFTGIQPDGETMYLKLEDINRIVFKPQETD